MGSDMHQRRPLAAGRYGARVIRRTRDASPGLVPRARRFVDVHGIWLDVPPARDWRQCWEDAAYQARWGGLALPPSPGSDDGDGGPRMLCVGTPAIPAAVGMAPTSQPEEPPTVPYRGVSRFS
jgi:hypothetical protein